MSIEEKAKAYDEVLERAKKSLRAASDIGTDIVTFIFPQLAESEDERIRKAIQLILIATEDEQKVFYSTHGLTRKDCTDWLEKQKEPKKEFHFPPNFGMAYYNPKPIEQKEHKPTQEEWELNSLAYLEQLGYTCIPEGAHVTVNQDDELNDEIKRFVAEYGYERGNDILLIAIVARHFAQWGAEHLKNKNHV